MTPSVLDGSLLGMPHPVLDLGEGLLDRIEVRGVGRQEPEPGAGGLYDVPDGCGFVAAEIVHDDDVAGPQDRNELLTDIGSEAFAVDRPVEDAWRREFVAAQRTQEGQRAPVAVRGKAAQALSPRSPAAQWGHVGLDPGFVDEDDQLRIDATLPRSPTLASASDVSPSLLKREQRFF